MSSFNIPVSRSVSGNLASLTAICLSSASLMGCELYNHNLPVIRILQESHNIDQDTCAALIWSDCWLLYTLQCCFAHFHVMSVRTNRRYTYRYSFTINQYTTLDTWITSLCGIWSCPPKLSYHFHHILRIHQFHISSNPAAFLHSWNFMYCAWFNETSR